MRKFRSKGQFRLRIRFKGEWEDLLQYAARVNANVNGQYYRERLIPRRHRPNEPRLVLAPVHKLKMLQKTVKNILANRSVFPMYVQGSVKGRDFISNAKRHVQSQHFFQTDIRGFYPSISSGSVYTVLEKHFEPDIAHVLTLLTTLDGKLATGSPTSAVLSNLVLVSFDQAIYDLCEAHGLTYSRYVDDITISGIRDFSQSDVPQTVFKLLAEEHFNPHLAKTSYSIGTAIVTGVLIKSGRFYPTRSQRDRFIHLNSGHGTMLQVKGSRMNMRRIGQANSRT